MLDKRKIIAGSFASACIVGALCMFGCSSSSVPSGSSATDQSADANTEEISVYSREDGSGTRGAFIELFGLEEKDADGNKIDTTTDAAAITNSTSVMMTSVASDPAAIGYISLGSLNDSVKAVDIDGVEATPENVKSGAYKASRPFNIVVTEAATDSNPAAQDFINFIMSADGQAIVEENKYIPIETAEAYQASGVSGKVVVAGSSSVTPVMEKLVEAYKGLNPDVTVEVQQSDSTTGVNMAVDGTCDIGMASRDLKDSEIDGGATAIEIARDGIAVIVAPTSDVNALTSMQIKDIFSGALSTWGEVIG